MNASQERLRLITLAVEKGNDCKAKHIESVPVIEMFGKRVAWQGVVEVFELTGHPKAKRAYGWAFQDGKETRFLSVLELPPVDSPNTAVRMAIAAKAQK